MEKEQVEELLNLMRGAYPQMFNLGNEVGKAQLKMWRDYFLEWDYEKAKRNLRKHIESSVFAPKVAEIKPKVHEHEKDYLSEIEQLMKGDC